MPSCDKCAELKEELAKKNLKGVEVDAGEDEGVAEIRQIYPKIRDKIKRTEDGSFPFPTTKESNIYFGFNPFFPTFSLFVSAVFVT